MSIKILIFTKSWPLMYSEKVSQNLQIFCGFTKIWPQIWWILFFYGAGFSFCQFQVGSQTSREADAVIWLSRIKETKHSRRKKWQYSRSQKSSHKSRFLDTELFVASLNPLKFKIRPCFFIQIPSFIELRGQQPNLVHFLGWMATSGEIIDSKISSANCHPNKGNYIQLDCPSVTMWDYFIPPS